MSERFNMVLGVWHTLQKTRHTLLEFVCEAGEKSVEKAMEL